jgi:rhamnulokinase
MVGEVSGNSLSLHEVHRFPNAPVTVGGTLHWDVLALYQGVLDGVAKAGQVSSIGVDTWAVDYGLLGSDGALLGNPVHYRDARTTGISERVRDIVPAAELYATTGVQYAQFNTVYQLVAAQGSSALSAAKTALLMPDLITYWLTNVVGTEITNASTTQLIDPVTRDWAYALADKLGIDLGLFPPIRQPGELAGYFGGIPVVTVGSHDTASAVVAVPAATKNFAYICTGTWSLVGVELDAPVLTEESRIANFTNELGVDGTVRYLRNVMGLWLMQECLRSWGNPDLAELLALAAAAPGQRSVIDAANPIFLAPGEMPTRIANACLASGQPAPRDRGEMVRCILDSLALAHRDAINDASRLSGAEVDVVHIVGGGAHNELLCQLTADACGLPVIAGPAEAAALGNILVQARAAGVVAGDLFELRALLGSTQELRRYEPNPAKRNGVAA